MACTVALAGDGGVYAWLGLRCWRARAIVAPSFNEEPRAWFLRVGFDLSFYLVVAVIMLNGA
jgi:hypothetical protein